MVTPAASSPIFFPSISVDRGFFFTLIMRVVVGGALPIGARAWLAFGTPRGSASPHSSTRTAGEVSTHGE